MHLLKLDIKDSEEYNTEKACIEWVAQISLYHHVSESHKVELDESDTVTNLRRRPLKYVGAVLILRWRRTGQKKLYT